jgi:flagellar secretion chaperone FliS
MYARAARSYKSVYLESASPSRLIDEMYARLLRDLAHGRTGLKAGDPGQRGEALGHALEIVGALNAALDRRLAPQLCSELGALYLFVMEKLSRANIHDDGKALDEAEQVVLVLQDAFHKAGQATT